MHNQIKQLRKAWKKDYQLSTLITSSISAVISTAFTLYNGILGIVYQSLWHGSICVYYLCLSVIRAILILTRRKNNGKIFVITHILLLIMDIMLIVPIAVMVKGERSYTYGLIPAIAMATYTTYRITVALIHFSKSKKNNSLMISELRMINLTDALVAVLSLQNALITANGGMNDKMHTLTAWTSAGILFIIVVITIRSFMKVKNVPSCTTNKEKTEE